MTLEQDRTRGLRLAAEFLQQLHQGDAARLPADLARQVPYLVRHFPSIRDIADQAQSGGSQGFGEPWLLPEEHDSSGNES